MNTSPFRLLLAVLVLAALACGISTPAAPAADPHAFNTRVALTANAQPTQLAAADPPPSATPIPPPTDPASPTAVPTDVYAPDPLGPLFSSLWFANGACYDMDLLFTANDSTCDIQSDQYGTLHPQNGALFSGYASMTPPSLNQCKAAVMDANPLAMNSDLYLCFKTNLGRYGFWVARQMDSSGFAFDAYVFP
jgi:hypothetical protein